MALRNCFAITGISLLLLAPCVLSAAEGSGAHSFSVRVDALFAGWDNTTSPGCSVAVMREGVIVHKRGYGMANLDHGVPNRPDTVFQIASTSKQFTAAAIALLVVEGKLSLDDDVRKYVRQLPDFGAPITIRHLIHHTSGLREQNNLLELSGWRHASDVIGNVDVMAIVSRQKTLNFPPNTRFSYSNTGYTLLALVVESVTGRTLRQFTDERIFKPLGMSSTFFRDDHAQIVHNLASGYQSAGTTYKSSLGNFDAVGGLGVVTTVEDMLLWEENFHEPRVGGPAFVAQLLQRGVLDSGEPLDYAFGLWLGEHLGVGTIGHAGSFAGYRADVLNLPERRFSVVCLCNRNDANPWDLVQKVADIYLEREAQSPTLQPREPRPQSSAGVNLTSAQLARHEGTYLLRGNGIVERFMVKDGRLYQQPLRWGGWGEAQPLVALDEARFLSVSGSHEIVFSGSGAARYASITWQERSRTGDTGPAVFELVPPHTLGSPGLHVYAGTYDSDEIGVPYHVEAADGRLALSLHRSQGLALEPVARDIFSSKFGILTFQRKGGRVSGFVINHPQVVDLRFAKH